MLYTILKPVMKAALRLYFSRIQLSGLEGIDNGKPTIILANHTASFLDAIILACFVKRRIHFFARGDVFTHRSADRVLRAIGLLPVYRLSEGREKLHLNDTSNTEALHILQKGGAVVIFAEGISDVDKILMPLKKGPFRLAAIAATTLPEPPMLVSLGINYSTPVKPFGDIFLIGTAPISSSGFFVDNTTTQAKAATEMMRYTADALTPLVWNVHNPSDIRLADGLFAILKDIKPDYSFADSQRLVSYLNTGTPQQLDAMRNNWEEYHLWQRQYSISDSMYKAHPALLDWILFVVLLPLAILGYYGHRIPLQAAAAITSKKVEAPDFWAPVFLSCSVVFTFLWYLAWILIGILWPALLPVLLALGIVAVSGIIYVKVYRRVLQRASGLLHRLLYPRRNPSHAMVDTLRRALSNSILKAIGHT
jgi:1-acyl-sn-glycerol-3-phosphate acyltransferase